MDRINVFSKEINQSIKREQRLLRKLIETKRSPQTAVVQIQDTERVVMPPLRPNPFIPTLTTTINPS